MDHRELYKKVHRKTDMRADDPQYHTRYARIVLNLPRGLIDSTRLVLRYRGHRSFTDFVTTLISHYMVANRESLMRDMRHLVDDGFETAETQLTSCYDTDIKAVDEIIQQLKKELADDA